MPIKLTNIRFNVQARPYDQKSLAEQHAVFQLAQQPVPSLCRDIINGTTGYLHSGYEVRSTTEATFFAPIWENIAAYTGSLRHWI